MSLCYPYPKTRKDVLKSLALHESSLTFECGGLKALNLLVEQSPRPSKLLLTHVTHARLAVRRYIARVEYSKFLESHKGELTDKVIRDAEELANALLPKTTAI